MSSKRNLTAYCGIDCFNCEVYEANITPELRTRLALQLKMSEEQVQCRGCRAQKGCRLHWNSCATLDCVTAKGLEFCNECEEFPCPMLQPAADGAGFYPHNMKVFNLSRMKAVGIEKWAEEASDIRRRYYKGKFVVGRGPVIE